VSADLQPMAVAPQALGEYAPAAGVEALERVRAAAEPLRGARIAHVSAAATGGRVPDLLGSLLPLQADLGLQVEWRVLFGGPELKVGVGALHEGAQGAETALDLESWSAYLDNCQSAAEGLGEGWDAIVLHDPGTLGLAAAVSAGATVWRCHLDASSAEPDTRDRLVELSSRCDGLVFAHDSFAPAPLRGERLHVAAPGIDPLSARNLELAPRLVGRLVRPHGVDLSRPFIFQPMRLDRWKDPHATIEAFALAKKELPALQLVIAGALDEAVTEEWRAAKEVSDYAGTREDVRLVTSYDRVGDVEIGALQRLSRVTVHRAIREGFGLAASEALWKGTPVVGRSEGGLPLQVRDGVDGYLVESVEETAARVVELVRDPGLAVEMGRAGRERVREHFLVTRMLEDELHALAAVVGAGTVGRS
jgi:trehalose synthase